MSGIEIMITNWLAGMWSLNPLCVTFLCDYSNFQNGVVLLLVQQNETVIGDIHFCITRLDPWGRGMVALVSTTVFYI